MWFYRIGKIVFIIFLFLIITIWSFYYQEQKKIRQFVDKINSIQRIEDPIIKIIFDDFITITNFDTSNQCVKIILADFPFVLNWMGIQNKEIDINLIGDTYGIAIGMNDDSKIEIYLNHKDWNKLTSSEKRKLLYHELIHDCYNLDHVENSCDIMASQLINCPNLDLNQNLIQIMKKINPK